MPPTGIRKKMVAHPQPFPTHKPGSFKRWGRQYLKIDNKYETSVENHAVEPINCKSKTGVTDIKRKLILRFF